MKEVFETLNIRQLRQQRTVIPERDGTNEVSPMIASAYCTESFQDTTQIAELGSLLQLRKEFGVQGDQGCQSFQSWVPERNKQCRKRVRPGNTQRFSFKSSADYWSVHADEEAPQGKGKNHPQKLEEQSLELMWEGPRIMCSLQPEWKTLYFTG